MWPEAHGPDVASSAGRDRSSLAGTYLQALV